MLRDTDAPSPPVRESLAGRHVLLTGATGFLGKVWLVHTLLHLPAIGRITAVVRPSRGRSGRERLEAVLRTSPALRPLRARHGEALGAWLASRLEVVEGDVTRPGLGLDPEVAARLASEVDITLHCAGLTDFQPDPVDALTPKRSSRVASGSPR